jgi:protein-S-isoprenylcysteine O-methyltransferase Ste14
VKVIRHISRIAPVFVAVPILILLIRGNLFSWSPLVILTQLLALALNVWARTRFPKGAFRVGPEPACGDFLRIGPYRWIRHPMYASALLFLWAGVLAYWSWINAILALTATAGAAVRIVDEERMRRGRYPAYSDYTASTKRVVPFLL